jgi:hypothetical protein
MERVYLVCALAGGTIFACHLMMGLLGLGDSHDSGWESAIDGHWHDGGNADAVHWILGVLSLRSLLAGVTFFGLGGLATSGAAGSALISAFVATGAGLVAVAFVAWVMYFLGTLRADGTIRIERAVGSEATVYLPIPAHKAGAGKVTLVLQNRTMEYPAVTAGDALAAGEPVVVVGVAGPDTVEVSAPGEQALGKLLRAEL